MGSFQEVCAISGLQIRPGDKVKLLFLTQGPYVVCDQHYCHRGVYHHDNWFLRTPPISGEYADYGNIDIEAEEFTQSVIEEMFHRDVVEEPFGFNQFHAHPITKKSKFIEYLDVAKQGRLRVRDLGSKAMQDKRQKLPVGIPSWKRVKRLLKNAKLPIMKEEKQKGFNAQNLKFGLVAVHFNEYDSKPERFNKVVEILSEHYNCKIEKYNQKCVVLVSPKNMELLTDKQKFNEINSQRIKRKLPVQAVMVRQDIWDLYLTLHDENIEEKSEKIMERYESKQFDSKKFGNWETELEYTILRNLFFPIPFQIMLPEHIKLAFKSLASRDIIKTFVKTCLEAAKVEMVLGKLNNAWHIPCLGGQDDNIELHLKINEGIKNILTNEESCGMMEE